MEASKLRAKAKVHKIGFLNVLEQRKGMDIRSDECISLESKFNQFINSTSVQTYYELVPLIAILLERVKANYITNNELLRLFDTIQKKQENEREMTRLFTKIQDEVFSMLMKENTVRLMKQQDIKSLEAILRHYWDSQFDQYMSSNMNRVPLTTQFILENLLGLRLNGNLEQYEKRWIITVMSFLSEEDYENMRVIANLDDTEREVIPLYKGMMNMVSFDALVMLTIWRIGHSLNRQKGLLIKEGNILSITEILKPIMMGVEKDWILLYGRFVTDYQRFLTLHHFGYEGRPVHINVFYIDFETSPHSQATHIDLYEPKDHQSPLSFGALFAMNGASLELSYMYHV